MEPNSEPINQINITPNIKTCKKELFMNVQYLYEDGIGRHCGYCNSSQGSYSLGFVSSTYPIEIYEKMMFEGWRRCGDYTYRPNLEKSCCKSYSCRLDVDEFKIDKHQKRVMRNFRKYLIGEFDETTKNNKNE